jgi:uncharacterized membrane protein
MRTLSLICAVSSAFISVICFAKIGITEFQSTTADIIGVITTLLFVTYSYTFIKTK